MISTIKSNGAGSVANLSFQRRLNFPTDSILFASFLHHCVHLSPSSNSCSRTAARTQIPHMPLRYPPRIPRRPQLFMSIIVYFKILGPVFSDSDGYCGFQSLCPRALASFSFLFSNLTRKTRRGASLSSRLSRVSTHQWHIYKKAQFVAVRSITQGCRDEKVEWCAHVFLHTRGGLLLSTAKIIRNMIFSLFTTHVQIAN